MRRSKPINSSSSSARTPSRPKRQTVREYHELQRLMAGAVMRPLGVGDAMQSKWTDGRSMKRVAGGFIKPNDRLTSSERLEIYNRQYWFRVKDCFYDDYPGLRAILGERKFQRLTLAYLTQHPSVSFTLRNLGRRLVEFLQAEPRWTAPQERLALDMARLEWAHTEAFDNEAKPPMDMEQLLGVDVARIRLRLQPHLSLLELGYDVDDLLIELKEGAGLRTEASNAMEQKRKHTPVQLRRKLNRKTIYVAVHRFNDRVYYKRLDEGQFRVLSALQHGASLAKACETLVDVKMDGDPAARLKQWFENWASLGWFCGSK